MPAVKTLMRFCITVLLFSSAVFAYGAGKLVLIMDDLGNQHEAGLEAIQLPMVTTVAIMPARPYSKLLADYAHSMGKEIIIHAPMSNEIDFPLGPLGLDREVGKTQFLENIRQSIASVPHAIGLSNHMGSRLTKDAEAMAWLMRELRQQDFYFFDSRTVSTTVGWEVADRYQVPWSMRHFFLDHFRNDEFMASQWEKALERAKAGENITVICHPYPETIAFLKKLTQDVEFSESLVPLSSVLNYPYLEAQKQQNFLEKDV